MKESGQLLSSSRRVAQQKNSGIKSMTVCPVPILWEEALSSFSFFEIRRVVTLLSLIHSGAQGILHSPASLQLDLL